MEAINEQEIAEGAMKMITITLDSRRLERAAFGCFGWRMRMAKLLISLSCWILRTNLEIDPIEGKS